MNHAALRAQVLSYGFDQSQFLSRVTVYLNDAQAFIARRVGFYTDEAILPFATVAGTATYPWPADLARVRELTDPTRRVTLTSVTLSDIDRSQGQSGQPSYYALDGPALNLFPVPDGVYTLELRYWKLPMQLNADADTPNLPESWHRLLWMWAVMECYAAEDDPTTAQYWKQRFDETLAEFAADAKFPSTDMPSQVKGMWDDSGSLSSRGWSVYSGW